MQRVDLVQVGLGRGDKMALMLIQMQSGHLLEFSYIEGSNQKQF